jgi:hypothetical protein
MLAVCVPINTFDVLLSFFRLVFLNRRSLGLATLVQSARPGRAFVARRILQHADALYGNQRSTCDHLVKDGDQTIDVCLIVNDLDHDRQVCGQLDQAGRVNDTVRAKPCDAMHDSRTGKSLSPETLQERSRQRRVVPLVGFAEKDANEELIAVEYAHRSPPSLASEDSAGRD